MPFCTKRTYCIPVFQIDNAEHGGDVFAGGKVAVKLIDECMEKGVCFAQETTLSGKKTAKTAEQALEKGYYIRLYYVGLNSVEESVRRIANRVAKGGHNISAEDGEKRYKTRNRDIAAVLPYCHEAVFYDNENGFKVVAEYANGNLNFSAPNPPIWITELSDILKNS